MVLQDHIEQPARRLTPEQNVFMLNKDNLLESKLNRLKDNRTKCEEFEQIYKKVCQHNKEVLVMTTEKQIRAEFDKLHQFLRELEEERVLALYEEEKQKAEIVTREMKTLQKKISSLSDQISDIEELQKPNVSFCIDQYSITKPQPVSGMLIDVAKHLGNLNYRICEEIKEKVMFSPVILDPNTANGYLCLSEDLTSVKHTESLQKLPDNPERFTMYPSVLGSEGFSSGTHTWEVEVGGHPRWNVGYVKKSVDRRGERSVTPEDGTLCLSRHGLKYTNGVEYITVKGNPQRIRVQLDYDKGEVSFHDTEDMTHIYTHRGTFTEELYPYLNYEKVVHAETSDIRICQVARGCQTCVLVSGSCQRGVALSPTHTGCYRRAPKQRSISPSAQSQTLPKKSQKCVHRRKTPNTKTPKSLDRTDNQRDSQQCVLQ